ncbi:NAD(P)-dependent oxidoreductase [soil metagenome]
MSLLITGATGFVGRNLILRALAGSETVHAVVRDEPKLRTQLKAENAATDQLQILPVRPDLWPVITPARAVLSAGVLFGRSREEYFATNVDWTLSIIRALPEHCRIVILSSLAAAGPTPDGISALRESDEDHPITWYGKSKLALEQAVRAEFPHRHITILRPPMIFGPRDSATLPIFRMTRGPLRFKPGLADKHYSFIAVDDLIDAIFAALDSPQPLPTCYVAYPTPISDRELITSSSEKAGLILPIPYSFLKPVAAVVDALPALRKAIPSLSGDRVLEVWADRWVVDSSKFIALTGLQPRRGLQETMKATRAYYLREGLL